MTGLDEYQDGFMRQMEGLNQRSKWTNGGHTLWGMDLLNQGQTNHKSSDNGTQKTSQWSSDFEPLPKAIIPQWVSSDINWEMLARAVHALLELNNNGYQS